MKKLEQELTPERFAKFLCSKDLGKQLGRVDFKFVRDMLVGMTGTRSVNLTAIATALKEDIRVHATHKRLSRNLDDPELAAEMSDRLLRLGAERVNPNTRLIVHLYEINKKYARRVEYLAKAQPGAGAGFKVCEVLASEPASESYTPILAKVWSEKVPGFVSDAEEIRKVVHRVRRATGGKGMFFFDDRIMDFDLLVPILEDAQFNFTALIGFANPSVLYRNNACPVLSLLDDIETPYGKTMFKLVPNDAPGFAKNTDLDIFMHAGAKAIKLPNSSRNLRLIALKAKDRFAGESVAPLITTETNLRSRKSLMGLVESFLSIHDVISAHQALRDSFDPASFRVLTYSRLQLLLTLMESAIYYEAEVNGGGSVNEHLFSRQPHEGNLQRTYFVPNQQPQHQAAKLGH